MLLGASPETSSRPASQIPLRSNCPARGTVPAAGAASAIPITSMSPVIAARDLFQETAFQSGAAGSAWPATSARLAPDGSEMAAVPVRPAASDVNPGTTMTPTRPCLPTAYRFHSVTALSSVG